MTCVAPSNRRRGDLCRNDQQPGSLFCSTHERASVAQRGGWLSAWKRRLKMLGGNHIDASNVFTRLWVGSKPPFDRDMPDFDVLVLCAAELQPEALPFHGRVVRCPIPDDALSDQQVRQVIAASKAVALALANGRRVLVTCSAGMNRSVLVASLALYIVTRMSSGEIIGIMRSKRHPNALYNRYFQALLGRFVGDGR
jgi:hypothetical protein